MNNYKTLSDIDEHLRLARFDFTISPTDDGFRLNLFNEELNTIESLLWINSMGALCTKHMVLQKEDLTFYQKDWKELENKREKEYFGEGFIFRPLEYVNVYVFRLVKP